MASAFDILKDFSNDKLQNVERVTTDFLKPVLNKDSSLDSTSSKGYGNFAARFLHAAVTKLKTLTDVSKIQDLLHAIETCCACYMKVQQELSLDDEYYVPKLVFHVLNTVKHEDYISDLKPLCEHMLTFLFEKSPLPAAGEKITQSFFGSLWNLANQLGPQKENKLKKETVLEVRKYALLFRCLLPNQAALSERIRDTMSQVVAINKDCKDRILVEKCNVISIQMFSDILKYWKSMKISKDISFPYLNMLAMFMEHLTEIGHYDTLEKVISEAHTCDVVSCMTSSRRQMLEILSYLYRVAVRIKILTSNDEHSKGGSSVTKGDNALSGIDNTTVQKDEIPSNKTGSGGSKTKATKGNNNTKLKGIHSETESRKDSSVTDFEFGLLGDCKNNNLIEFIHSLTHEEVILLFWGFQYVCMLIGVTITDLSCFPSKMIEILLNCSDNGVASAKSWLESIQTQEKQGNDGLEKNGSETFVFGQKVKERIYSGLLSFYFRKLLLMNHLLGFDDSASIPACDCIASVASEFDSYLELSSNILSAKVLHLHRKNCAYICSKAASFCTRQAKNYTAAIILHTIVTKQLRICGSSQTKLSLSSLIYCYTATAQWQEAIGVILESTAIEGDATSCVASWVDLKREALENHQTAFLQKTLSSVISQLDNHKINHAELLVLEYNAWKKISRRNYTVEFYILCELLDKLDSGVEKYTYLIELAKNMCMTGLLYKERSANAILTEVIDQLDDTSPLSQAVLAMANFTKCVVLHEESILELTAKLQPEGNEVPNHVDETGDTAANHKTPDRPTSIKPTNQGSSFTLASEKPYLKYLHIAVELWEKCMGRGDKIDGIDLNCHIEAIVACGTRLVAMKQHTIALKVLQIAQCQISNLKDSNFTSHLEEKLAKVLMLLGKYQEAEQLINSNHGNGHTTTSRSLLKAELYLFMGKKQEGIDILNQVLGEGEGAPLTKSLCLVSGSAKRLLSMFLCFPGNHLVDANSQYLLTLANEAVRRHISVLRLVDKPETSDRKSDSVEKWTSVLEALQSLLHLCQLYRVIGLPRSALCYLKEGWKISQAQGLPRWACAFLFEMLRVQSMEADSTSAIDTVDEINAILNCDNSECQSVDKKNLNTPYDESLDLGSSDKVINCVSSSHSESVKLDIDVSPDSFGFKNLAVTPKGNRPRSSITPGKNNYTGELDSCQKQKLAHVSIPLCQCLSGERDCKDASIHRLYSEAGLVIAEFLTACDMKTKAFDILDKLVRDNKMFVDFSKMVKGAKSAPGKVKSKPLNGTSGLHSEHFEPSIKYLSLEANCILAEAFGQDKKYDKVQQIWYNTKKLDESGFFVDVLHGNILVARLAHCEATSLLQTLFSSNKTIDLDVTALKKYT